MDQYSNFMNGNYSKQAAGSSGGTIGFNDMAGFGNQMCLPVQNTRPSSDPMPTLPSGNEMFASYMKSGSDFFGSFANESQTGNNGLMASQLNGGGSQVTENNDFCDAFDDSNANDASPFDKSKSMPPSKSGIKFYSRNDVLCGRGGGTNVHPGNRRFRDLINANRRAYLKARKNDKPAISRSIVRTIRELNGRFLKKDEKLGLWFEIGDDGAREKTSQALRQRAPEMKKILFEDEQRMRNEQLARQQQQAALMQRSFINNQSMNNNNFSRNSQMLTMDNSNMDVGNFGNSELQSSNSNNGSIHEQYAMLQQKNYFARENDVFLKKLAMTGFDPTSFQSRQRDIESLMSQTLLSQGIKPITPRGA